MDFERTCHDCGTVYSTNNGRGFCNNCFDEAELKKQEEARYFGKQKKRVANFTPKKKKRKK